MIKHLTLLGTALLFSSQILLAQWKPAGDKIRTFWAEKVDVNNVLPEYPRPIMERSDWQNLNGLWNYAVLPLGQSAPTTLDGKILVPFAIESSLSGVGKNFGDGKRIMLPTCFYYSFQLERQESIAPFWRSRLEN